MFPLFWMRVEGSQFVYWVRHFLEKFNSDIPIGECLKKFFIIKKLRARQTFTIATSKDFYCVFLLALDLYELLELTMITLLI